MRPPIARLLPSTWFAALTVIFLACGCSAAIAAELCANPTDVTCSGMGSTKACSFVFHAGMAYGFTNQVSINQNMNAVCRCFVSGSEDPGCINVFAPTVTVQASGCTATPCSCSFRERTRVSLRILNTCVIDDVGDGLPVELLFMDVD